MPDNDVKAVTDGLKSMVTEGNSAEPYTDNQLELKIADYSAIQKHQNAYSSYLEAFVEDYREKSKKQRRMKGIFFWITLVLLSVIIAGGVSVFIIILRREDITAADAATAVAAVAGAVSSFIVLPKVIAENLFPSKEDNESVGIFKTMLESDSNLRNRYSDPGKEDRRETDRS